MSQDNGENSRRRTRSQVAASGDEVEDHPWTLETALERQVRRGNNGPPPENAEVDDVFEQSQDPTPPFLSPNQQGSDPSPRSYAGAAGGSGSPSGRPNLSRQASSASSESSSEEKLDFSKEADWPTPSPATENQPKSRRSAMGKDKPKDKSAPDNTGGHSSRSSRPSARSPSPEKRLKTRHPSVTSTASTRPRVNVDRNVADLTDPYPLDTVFRRPPHERKDVGPTLAELQLIVDQMRKSNAEAGALYWGKYSDAEDALQTIAYKINTTREVDLPVIYTWERETETVRNTLQDLRTAMFMNFPTFTLPDPPDPMPNPATDPIGAAAADTLTQAKQHLQNENMTPLDAIQWAADELKAYYQNLTEEVARFKQTLVQQTSSRGNISRAMIPKFSGDHTEWLQFKGLFTSLTKKMDDQEKIYLLFESIKGTPAYTTIMHMKMIGENFESAWSRLVERYDSKWELLHVAIRSTLEMQVVERETHEILYSILGTAKFSQEQIKQCVLTPEQLHDAFSLHIIMGKLPEITLNEFNRYCIEKSDNQFPTLDMMFKFLKERAQMLSLQDKIRSDVKAFRQPSRPAVTHQRSVSFRDQRKSQPFLHNAGGSSTGDKKKDKKRTTPSSSSKNTKGQRESSSRPSAQPGPSQAKLCPVCTKANHRVHHCTDYKEMTVPQKKQTVIALKLCHNCLGTGHSVKQCTNKTHCLKCGKPHHTTIHVADTASSGSPQRAGVMNLLSLAHLRKSQNSKRNAIAPRMPAGPPAMHSATDERLIPGLLPSTTVWVKGRRQPIWARALVDTCAQGSIISLDLVRRMKIPFKEQPTLFTLAGKLEIDTLGTVEVTIMATTKNGSEPHCLLMHVMRETTTEQPDHFIDIRSWTHLSGLELADEQFNIPAPIDMIIGQPFYDDISLPEKICGQNGLASAHATTFGYIVQGRCVERQPRSSILNIVANRLHSASGPEATLDQLTANLAKFWELEQLPPVNPKLLLTAEEMYAEDHFQANTTRLPNGRYQIRWPVLKPYSELGASFRMAKARWESVERKLERRPALHAEYLAQLKEYLDLGQMEKVPVYQVCRRPSYYIPHHEVIKESSTTTKLRIVYDASAKTSTKLSLNDLLPAGIVVQPELLRQSLHIREFAIAFVGDLSKMYRQIMVHPEEHDMQRLVFRPNSQSPIEHYRIKCVPFGVTSAPYIATKVLQHLADSNQDEFPEASEVLRKRFYMDDLSLSFPDNSKGKQIIKDLVQILESAKFHLRKFASNCMETLEGIPEEDREIKTSLELDESPSIKTLGIRWLLKEDAYSFVANPNINLKHTKRVVLSEISKIYDPLGLISPVTIKGKILMQKIWLEKCNWDAPLPKHLSEMWTDLATSIANSSIPLIPRVLVPHVSDVEIQLHGFSDASKEAYAAAVYIRVKMPSKTIYTNLVLAKSRVAPLNPLLTIPRLELQAAVMLSELMEVAKETLMSPIDRVYYWTDSAIVLHWLQSTPQRWKLFVANRIATIQSHSTASQWGHVTSENNPADAASRGVLPHELTQLWWKGPFWLWDEEISQPPLPGYPDTPELELAKTHPVALALSGMPTLQPVNTFLDNIRRIGGWYKTIRVLGKIIFAFHKKSFAVRPTASDLSHHIEQAESVLARLIQMENYPEFFEHMARQEGQEPALQFYKNTKYRGFKTLNPFILNGTIRAHSRMTVTPTQRCLPVILPGYDPLVQALIIETHQTLAHAGARVVVNSLRSIFWIVNGVRHAKSVISKCLICFRFKAKPMSQQMGMLPAARTTFVRPFLYTGVDFAGPYFLRNMTGRGGPFKAWVALFTCMATRAIHLEIVSSLSAESFLLAFRRFIARRGKPARMYSDNGTNFTYAAKHLKAAEPAPPADLAEKVKEWGLDLHRIKWHFSPPGGPHHGGTWEICVRLVKTHLRTQLSEELYTWEQLETILLMIESIVNSRPILPMDNDIESLEVLTPGHFLIGTNLLTFPEDDLTNIRLNRLSHYQLITRRFQDLWARFHRDYLAELFRSSKWLFKQPNVKEGAMVLMMEENATPLQWRVGRVKKVHPGPDGLVRVVTVDTAKAGSSKEGVKRKEVVRPIVKLAPLPLDNDEPPPLLVDESKPVPYLGVVAKPRPTITRINDKTTPWLFISALMLCMKSCRAENPLQMSETMTVTVAVVGMFITILGTGLNFYTIFTTIRCLLAKSDFFNGYRAWTLCLAVADFILAGFLIPLSACRHYFRQWIFGMQMCRIFSAVLYGTVTWIIFILVAIAALRFQQLGHLASTRKTLTRPVVVLVMQFFFMSYLLPGLAFFEIWGTISIKSTDPTVCTITKGQSTASPKTFIWFTGVVLPGFLIYALTFATCIRVHLLTVSSSVSTVRLERVRCGLFEVVSTYFWGYQPMLLVNAIDNGKTWIPMWVHLGAMFLAWSTTIVHPWVYFKPYFSASTFPDLPGQCCPIFSRAPRTPQLQQPPAAAAVAVRSVPTIIISEEPELINNQAPPLPPRRPPRPAPPVRLTKGKARTVTFLLFCCLVGTVTSVKLVPSVINELPECPGATLTTHNTIPPCVANVMWIKVGQEFAACTSTRSCNSKYVLSTHAQTCRSPNIECKINTTQVMLDDLNCQVPYEGQQSLQILKSLVPPDLCSFYANPVQDCSYQTHKTQRVPVLLVNGIIFPVREIHIAQHAMLNELSSYNCSCNSTACVNKGCTGDATFCRHIGCTTFHQPDTCYCHFTNSQIRRTFRTPSGDIYPDCFGTMMAPTTVRAQPPASESTCSDCTLICTATGVQLQTPGQTALYVTVTKNPNHLSVHPSTETTDIDFPMAMLVSHGDITAEVWLPDADTPYQLFTTCARLEICKAITCILCKERWINVACYTIYNWIIILTFLSLLFAVLIFVKYCVSFLYNILWYLTWPFRRLFKSRGRFRYLPHRRHASPPELPGYGPTQWKRRRPRPHSHTKESTSRLRNLKHGLIVLIFMICFSSGKTCSEFSSITASSTECQRYGTEERCVVQLNSRLALSPVGQTSCFKMENKLSQAIGMIQITTKSISITCEKQLLYYVPKPVLGCESSLHCYSLYASSDCHGNKCDLFLSNHTLSEFSHTARSLGWSGCVALRYPTCPWWLTRDCLFTRVSFTNPSRKSYEVFNCPTWRLSVNLNIMTTNGTRTFSDILTLDAGQDQTVRKVSYSLISTSVPPTPVLASCFLRNDNRLALTPCNQREEYSIGRIGEIQCDSSQDAQDLTPACQALRALITTQTDSDGLKCSAQLVDPDKVLSTEPLPYKLENGMLLAERDTVRYDTTQSSLLEIQLAATDLHLITEIQEGKCEASFIKITGCYSCLGGATLFLQAHTDAPTPVTASLECPHSNLYTLLVLTNISTYYSKVVQVDSPDVNLLCHLRCPLNSVPLTISGHLHYLTNTNVENTQSVHLPSLQSTSSWKPDFHWMSILGTSIFTWIWRTLLGFLIGFIILFIIYISFKMSLIKRD